MYERNIKLTIEYDGTNYHGWQRQNNAIAVQDVVSNAITKLTKEFVNLTGASRTDAGVHAKGQVANFKTNSKIPAEKFAFALNTILPEDIVIRKSEEQTDNFHSRFSSCGKKYEYIFYNHAMPSALNRKRAYHIFTTMDIENMQIAANYFLGTHDFEAFRASGCAAESTVRTINHSQVYKKEELIVFEVAGNSFLYNMVRIMAGTLYYVGVGKFSPHEIPLILQSKDRRRAGKTAPPFGLYLLQVFYKNCDEE